MDTAAAATPGGGNNSNSSGGSGIYITPVCLDGPVGKGDDLASSIAGLAALRDGDIVVVSQKAVSRQEGRTVQLDSVRPSLLAEGIASAYGKDPRIVELVLAESSRIIRMARGIIIVETHHGFVCANAGVDESNMDVGTAALLPTDPDASARRIRDRLAKLTGKSVAVLVSDTFGRPFRVGQTDCAIGAAGMGVIADYRGKTDSAGRIMRVSEIATADEVCAAAELVMGKTTGCPAAVVRGLALPDGGTGAARDLLRPAPEDLFR